MRGLKAGTVLSYGAVVVLFLHGIGRWSETDSVLVLWVEMTTAATGLAGLVGGAVINLWSLWSWRGVRAVRGEGGVSE